jgi:uncharacterized membrane protein
MTEAALLLLYFAAPLLLLYGSRRVAWMDRIGVVTLCYCVGIAMGNSPFEIHEALTVQVLELVVPLSIPLLLFGADLRIWRTSGGPMLTSFVCGVVAVSIAVATMSVFFRDTLHEVSSLGGMMMGVYTGGTPNMSAIGIALDVDSELFVVLNAADVLCGGAVLLFFLSIGKPLIKRILPAPNSALTRSDVVLDESLDLRGSFVGLGLSALVLGAALGIAMLLFGRLHEMTILLVITTLGIAGSSVPRIRNLKGTFAMGNYLLLVFCVAVGSLANLQQVASTAPHVLAYVGAIIGTTLVLHIAFARLFNIDADTMIISSVAGIFGPAFIAPVARAIRNPQVIPLGLALALLGFAIGNYCGLAMAYALKQALG